MNKERQEWGVGGGACGAPHKPLTTQTGSAVTTSLSPGILEPSGFLFLLVGGRHH